MHLKRIELHGFKTFATRTAIDLRPGVTAVVGPNGSGKSNVADAVRWALGETNLRQVRCHGTEELIFAGSGRRSSLGMAEVSLIFANEGGWLDLPFSEVRVSRRAYRSGENDYLLNGTRVRLRDVVDLLSGASIHAGGHVVLGQGMVDAVLSQRAEERRALVESLAGLKHFYLRRDEAEARLAATEANLVQVDALIAELAPRVAALAAQADDLRRYRAAADDLRALLAATFSVQATRLLRRQRETARELEEAIAALTVAGARYARLQEQRDALAAAHEQQQARRAALQEQARRRHEALLALRRDAAVTAARLTSAEERHRRAAAELALLAGRVEDARVALHAAVSAEASSRAACGEAEASIAGLRRERQQAAQARDAALAAHRAAESAASEGERDLARIAQQITVLTTRLEVVAGELRRQETQRTAARQALDLAETAHTQAGVGVRAAQEALDAARAADDQARVALEKARRIEAARSPALQETRRQADETTTRLALLRELHEQRDGYDEQARALAAHPAARGIAADLLRVPPAYQRALVLALGPLVQAVVTSAPDDLVDALAATGQDGHVRLVIADAQHADHAGVERARALAARDDLSRAGLLADDDAAGWAADLVEAPDLPSLPRCLGLERVLLVRDARTVLRCRAATRRAPLTLVAMDGSLAAYADGTLGQGAPARLAALLRRQHDLRELGERAAALRQAEARARADLEAARAALQGAESISRETRQALAGAQSADTKARDEARFQERLLAQARETARDAQARMQRLREEEALHARRREEHERARVAASDRQAGARARLHAAQRALADADAASSAATVRLREAERAAMSLRARLDAAAQLARERAHALAAAEQDQTRRAMEAAQASDEVARLAADGDAMRAREAAAAEAAAALEAEIQPLSLQLDELATQQTSARREVATAAGDAATAERARDRARQGADAARHELDLLRAQVAAELGCALDQLPDATPPANATARVRALREQLAAFGLVNARAEEDHAVLSERHTFLQTQAEDLRAGVARLRGIIADANATVRNRFAATVEDLHRHFTAFFERLFGGGACRLIGTYDARGLPSGMNIEAQPPGKRTRDLALLSGGERALVALALLFAMLKVRPVPFCLLDEVEAALDEANTGRFGAILRELSADTQFVVITHNRGTMLHADCLYGITMGETGISSIFALNLLRDDAGQIVVERSGA